MPVDAEERNMPSTKVNIFLFSAASTMASKKDLQKVQGTSLLTSMNYPINYDSPRYKNSKGRVSS